MSKIREEDDRVYVPVEVMRSLGAAIFEAAGSEPTEAKTIVTRLSGANLRGHDSHGVIRIPRYVQWVKDGIQVPNQKLRILSDQPGFAIVDGQYGFGQTIGEQAVDVGIEKAKAQGVAMVALRNSGHIGRIGDWAERAADAGLVSVHMVNVRGSLLVAPFGGVSRRSSTNPFCIGAPIAGSDHIVLDFATSLVAEGKALVALKGGKPLPDGAIVDGEGTITSDPGPLYGDSANGIYPDPSQGPGALRAFGEHKGFGMNFMMEVMAGALTGSGTAGKLDEPDGRRFCNGMLSFYIDLKAMDRTPREMGESFASEVLDYVDFVKSASPTQPGGEVLVPGEPERRLMAERLASGLPLARQAWDDIVETARTSGLDPEAHTG